MQGRWRFIIVLVLAVAAMRAAWAETASVLLEEGIYAEETVGDLDKAIEAYRRVLADPEATRANLARAHFRIASCLIKKGERAEAAEELDDLITRYPGQAEIVASAQLILDGLLLPDPASLMPPETFVYYEFGSPGQQIETLLKMLEGTPFENPLAAVGGGQRSGEKSPEDIMAALLNPSMIAEFKKVRGAACGFFGSGPVPQGRGTMAHLVGVLCPGKSDALRAILTAGIGMGGEPAEPVEGMQTVTFGGGIAGCAFDGTVFIVAAPPERLAWSVRQYKGVSQEPSLATAAQALPGLSREARQRNALTVWVDGARSFRFVAEEAEGSRTAEQVALYDQFADFESVTAAVARLIVDEKNPRIEAEVNLKENHESLAYDVVRTPALSRGGFEAVPREAVALASFALGEPGEAPTEARQQAVRRITGLDVGRELFANIGQVSLFLLPPPEGGTAGADPKQLLFRSVGLVVTSRDPQQTRALLDRLLGVPDALTRLRDMDLPAVEAVEGVKGYLIPVDREILPCYVGQAGGSTVVALDPQVVRLCLDAVVEGRSVLSGGALGGPLGSLKADTSKLLLVNVGGAVKLATAVSAMQGMPEEMAEPLARLAEAFAATGIRVATDETPNRLGLQLAAEGLPPLSAVLPMFMQIAQGAEARAQARRAAARAAAPPPGLAPAVPRPSRVPAGQRPVPAWHVVGPFELGMRDTTDAEREDLARYLEADLPAWKEPLPPEQELDLGATYAGKDGAQVSWLKVRAGPDGLVDLDAVCGPIDYAVACGVAYVHSPEGGTVSMTSTSDDSIMVRVNGVQVFRNHALRSAFRSMDVFEAQLRPGWNELLVKVTDRHGDWKFAVLVQDPDGVLEFSAGPPAAAKPGQKSTESQ